ncbi:MAG: inosine/xanthosine triphosphatase [Paraglaciecola sp.]
MNKHIIRVIVGSQNPVKVNAARASLAALYPQAQIDCLGIAAPSGVADQPMSAQETRIGALNRVTYCQQHRDADFYVAMEGGVDNFEYGPATFAYVVIASGEKQSVSRGAMMPIPPQVYRALKEGKELGDVMDTLFDTHNVKQRGGAIGLLTKGNASREGNYSHAITLAMAPFLYPELYA